MNIRPYDRPALHTYEQWPIYSGQVRNVDFTLFDIYAQCRPLPMWYENIRVKATIVRGEKYGELFDSESGQRGRVIENLPNYEGYGEVRFDANGEIANQLDSIVVKFEASDPAIAPVEAVINIIPAPIFVTINPVTLSAGDTATIILKKRNEDGSIEDFPPDQAFEIGMLEGCANGMIHTASDSGAYFMDVVGPFIFVASNSPDTTNTRVRIRAGIYQEIMAGSIRPGDMGTDTATSMKKQAMEEKLKTLRLNMSMRKPEKPTRLTSDESCELYDFEYNLCFGEGETAVENPELIVIIPHDEFHIKLNPEMPDLKNITAMVKNYRGKVKYHSQIIVKWKPPGSDIPTTLGYGETKDDYIEADAQQQTSLPVTWRLGIRGGDLTELFVQAFLDKGVLSKTERNKFKIIGCNPTNATFKAALAVSGIVASDLPAFEAITYQESGFQHFHPCPGFPYQGGKDANDIGICQINKPRNDDIIWDWRANIREGGSIFNIKKGYSNGYTSALKQGKVLRQNGTALYPLTKSQLEWYEVDIIYNPTPLTTEMLLKETIQKYNKGAYWRWKPENTKIPEGPGKWIAEPPNNYCESVWNFISNHPANWNADHSCQ